MIKINFTPSFNLHTTSSNKYLFLTAGFILLFFTELKAQEDWIDYVSMKNKGVMSVSVDLEVDISKPNYKNLLIIGTKYDSCMANGFPKEAGLEQLFEFSDSIASVINKVTRSRLVGIVTYQCMGFDIYYVKDTLSLRKNLKEVINKNFKIPETFIGIRQDKLWVYYYDMLYPKSFSIDFMIDQSYLHDLAVQGDDLKGLRKVDHWLYFKKLKNRNKAGERLKMLDFSLDSIWFDKNRSYPYELRISRKDSIDPSSISRLTSMLKVLCTSFKAQYDGWSTELIVKK